MSRLILLLVAGVLLAHVSAGPSRFQFEEYLKKIKTGPRETVTIGDETYFIGSAVTLQWIDALEICNAVGQSLVSFETIEENTAMKEYLADNNLNSLNYWTSAKEVDTDVWMWAGSGQLMTETDWVMGNPDQEELPKCVLLTSEGWDDVHCNLQQHFICQ